MLRLTTPAREGGDPEGGLRVEEGDNLQGRRVVEGDDFEGSKERRPYGPCMKEVDSHVGE